MSDILFTTVPYTDTDEPLMSPAVLKAIAQSAGYSAVAIDLNIELVNEFLTQAVEFNLVGEVGIEPTFAALSRRCLLVYKSSP